MNSKALRRDICVKVCGREAMMQEKSKGISKEILKAELSEDKRLRFTNKSHNEIYVITYQDSPNVMKEIGRLRDVYKRQL